MFFLLSLLACANGPTADVPVSPTEYTSWCPGLNTQPRRTGPGPDVNPGVTRIDPRQFLLALPDDWTRTKEQVLNEGDAGHGSGNAGVLLTKADVSIWFFAYDLIRPCTAKPGMSAALHQKAMAIQDGTKRREIEGASFLGILSTQGEIHSMEFWVEDRCSITLRPGHTSQPVSEAALTDLARNLDAKHLKSLCSKR